MAINYKNNLNKLIYGDNLTIMKEMPDNYVDLIYLDPPFNSNKNYNMMYKTMTGLPVPEQVEAFCDTWTFSSEDVEKLRMIRPTLEYYKLDSELIKFWDHWLNALRNTNEKLLSYLFYMMERLFEMKRILKPTGSIYLHCDPTASHYIKIMMDGVFGHKNFRNEIIWQRNDKRAKGSQFDSKKYGNNTDTILFYTKSNNYFFNIPKQELSDEELLVKFKKIDEKGKRYNIVPIFRSPSMGDRPNLCYEWRGFKNPDPSGWRLGKERLKEEYNKGNIIINNDKIERRQYLDNYAGTPIDNNWIDIKRASGNLLLGYPTQKPIALLERIVKASCKEDGIVFDPFCGCGTTIYATQKLNYEQKASRKWIGCDIAVLSTRLVKDTLELGKKPLMNAPLKINEDFELCGYPISVEGAKLLFQQDPKQFEHWAVEWVGGFINKKQSGDKGIDGRIYFEMKGKDLGKMVISVKGGKNINPAMVRELRGTMEREDSQFAGLILTEEPTKGMLEEASQAGQIEFYDYKYDKIQILTIKDMTVDKKIFFLPNRIGHKHKDTQIELYL